MRPRAKTAVHGERLAFVPASLAGVPASPGIYLLYRHDQLVYIGLAAGGGSIREQLRQHLRGLGGPCTRAATEFDYETSAEPLALYRHYVAVYLETSCGVLPECNEKDGR